VFGSQISALTVVAIALVVGLFLLFQNSLKLLSQEQRESFLRERPFSGTYIWIVFAIFVGMSFVDDFAITLTLAALAIACVAYEHRRNAISVKEMDAPAEFKGRMSLMAWLADAIVVILAAGAVLPYLSGVAPG
jgi:hypothetical protein